MAYFGGRWRIIFTFGSVFMAVLGLSGATFLQREAPRLGGRLAGPEAGGREDSARMGRLWQDPFAAIEKSFDTAGRPALAPLCLDTQNGRGAEGSPLTGQTRETLVIGVMLPGEPYSRDAEIRRRTRFAILAGLARKGFEPENGSTANYFSWPHPALDMRPSADAAQSRSTAWEKNAALAGRQETIIPYEWFGEGSQPLQDDKKDVLVLWLNEEVFKGEPFRKLSELKQFLYAAAQTDQADGGFKLIGPYSSNLLRDMVAETRNFAYAPPYDKAFGRLWGEDASPALHDVPFYTYGATAADDQLLGDLSTNYGTVPRFFEALGLRMQRTIATDRAVARGVVGELKRRGIGLGLAGADVALISEWDGHSSQSLLTSVERALGHMRPGNRSRLRDGSNPDRIHNFTYLPGLDGQLLDAGNTGVVAGSDETAQGEQQVAANIIRIHSEAKTFDRPMGQGQRDYLRRLSARLHELDNDLRRENRVLRAIGVLGSDVLDKLSILRALRPQFPDALFFTTDYDEALMKGSELAWTRNLIVSSSFGPTLHKNVQREIPPFRDTYQAAAFLATLLAIGDPAKNWTTPPAVPDYISGRLMVSRIFEIERSGNFLSLAGDSLPLYVAPSRIPSKKHNACEGNAEDCHAPLIASAGGVVEGRSAVVAAAQTIAAWDCRKDSDSTNCGDIQPAIGKLFPRFQRSSRNILGIGLAGSALLILGLLYLRILPRASSVEAWLLSLVLAIGAAACVFWEPLAQFLTEHGHGEPIALFRGVSVWPTVLLRGVGIVLALYLIWRAQQILRTNFERTANELRLDLTLPWSHEPRSFWNDLAAFFDSSCRNPAALEIKSVWRSYGDQEVFWLRFCRALSYTAAAYLIVSLVAIPLFGNPFAPVRGALAASAYSWTTFLFDLLTLFLTCFVLDATFCCLRFGRKLRHREPNWQAWPPRRFDDRLRQEAVVARDWENLEFVAKRARCIGALLSYPAALIALLAVTGGAAHANYAPYLSQVVTGSLSLAAVFGCAIILRVEANSARAAARQNLRHSITCAKGNRVDRIGRGDGAIEMGAGGG